jgi:hypothetical protein
VTEEPAPPYRGEGPHALWHVSEDATIVRFEPHVAPTSLEDEPLVWAIDTRHLPLYWFPRDCPRATFWPTSLASQVDVDAFLDGGNGRVHAIEWDWLERLRTARLFAYRLPEEPFEPYGKAAGYRVAREPVEPLEVVALAGPLSLHEAAGIELRLVPNLWPLWERVIASTLDFSGVRIRNAKPRRESASERPPGA